MFRLSWISQGQSSVEAGMAANTNADYSSKIIKAEEEVVKLMEVNMSSAMRFLQKKGSCPSRWQQLSLARILLLHVPLMQKSGRRKLFPKAILYVFFMANVVIYVRYMFLKV